MRALPESDEALVQQLLPDANPDPADRARAWAEWHARIGFQAVLKFIRSKNHTLESDDDILQESMMTAYVEVERGRYEHRAGIPFTAYVKGIARNKIREAQRKHRRLEALDDATCESTDSIHRHLETAFEHAEARQALWDGLELLPEQRRQVLERYLHGESPSEIASKLDMTEDLVRQHKHRGLKSLQRMSLFF
jgi:RNA polymerase sigma-70 factor (ECF subfamily)